MGYMTDGLSFNVLREENKRRMPQFKNAKGEPAHDKEDGSDWSLNDWLTAVTGELGEAANVLKKVRRGDFTINQAMPELADELADVATYLDILANQCGIDLGKAIIEKFNRVSAKVDSNIFIRADGSDYWIDADQ